ncbi:MAG: glycosyltransferase 87 family protein [Dehalococcoidales bacterium]
MTKQAKGNNQPPLKRTGRRLAFFREDIKPRIWLFFLAVLIQLVASAFSGAGYTLHGSVCWLVGMILWIIWFLLMFFIVTPQSDTLLQRFTGQLKWGAFTIFFILLIMGIGEVIILGVLAPWFLNNGIDNSADKLVAQMKEGFRYNDGTALSQQAAENLLEGKEPYTNANIVTALTKYNGAYDRLTPLQLGRFANAFPYPTTEQLKQVWDSALQNPSQPPPEIVSSVCYPAGSFLLVVPFIAAGVKDIRIVYIIFVIAALVYATWKIHGRKRLLFIGVAVISLELWNTLATGETGILIFPLLLIAWITLGENDWVSAIFMGLAVATKQTAWFFLPFYVILLWRTAGPKNIASAIGIITAVFIATNGYFIAKAPSLWLQSITSPMVEPMFPLGVGVISLVTSGYVNIQTSLPFTIAEVIVLIGAVLWYLRYCKQYPDVGPILAILPLFFAWRSIWTYFYYIPIIVLARMLSRDENNALTPTPSSR